LGTVLCFVGLKMVWLNHLFDGKFPIVISLGIIALVIGSSIALSLLFPRKPAESSQQNAQQLKLAPPARVAAPVLSWPSRHVLKKIIALYLLLLGLGLILGTALNQLGL